MDKPILFSGPMVRAILDGRKTQTRRIRKIDADRLWVRETWCLPDPTDRTCICYRASDHPVTTGENWRPSIFMPRWASRITLEVTGVRIERLQEITEEDARKEGILSLGQSYPGAHQFWRDYGLSGDGTFCADNPIDSFRTLWDSINGKKYPWKDNPFVWVIEFRRVPQ